jgi:type I restriction enzyme S subunit
MTTFPKYERYKNSCVEWLGEVPEHWEVEKGKWLFVKMERPVRPEDDVVTAFRDGQVTLRTNRRTEGFTNAIKEHGYQGVRKGDLVINAMDAPGGAIGVSESDGKSTPVYSVCVPRKPDTVSPQFYAYLLRYTAHSGYIATLAKGIRERSTDFRFNDFGALGLPLPPKTEQDRIVAFLDRKTAEIDALIAKKQRQIELLDEQKAILINRAVTRGLNPNAKLKPSGIEWIGEIPEHWEVKNLKYASTAIGTGRTPGTVAHFKDLPDGIHWYTPGDYQSSGYLDASERRAKSTRSETVETFPAGSLFYIGIGATLGRVNLSLHEAGCNQQINVIVINALAHTAEYMLHLLNSGREYIYLSSDFTTLPILNRSKTAALSVVAPPKGEQEAIAKYCADLVLKIQAAQAIVAEGIESLQTLRSTLIAHAVTGRIKIN